MSDDHSGALQQSVLPFDPVPALVAAPAAVLFGDVDEPERAIATTQRRKR